MKGVIKSKIQLTILLLITVCLVVFPAYAKYSGGTGEPNDPYQIATAGDLMLLGESPEDYDKHFIMIDDIDLDPNLPGGNVFDRAVIAPDVDPNDSDFQGSSFTGVFDGNGHMISHLTITGESYLGLFGHVGLQWNWFLTAGKITNLSIVDANITGSGDYIGGLVGNKNLGELTNCSSTGTISGNSGVGGLVGFNQGVVSDCHSTCVVNGDCGVGGLVGWNYGNVTNSYSTGVVGGETGVGGLVGRTDGDVTNSYSAATVSGENHVGGLVGVSYSTTGLLILPDPPFFIPVNDGYSTGSVSVEENTNGLEVTTTNLQDYDIRISVGGSFVINSFSSGAVRGKRNVGGLVGASYGPLGFVSDPWWFPPSPVPVQVTNCYSTSPVSGEEKVGGLVGYIDLYGSDVIHCYSSGAVNGSNSVGGLVGSGRGDVTACFWDIETSGQTTSDGGTGKKTDEMQMESTFTDAGWDFVDETANGTEDIWWILEGQDYPRLWWERSNDDMLFIVVDDFESYNDLHIEEPESNLIWNTWIDGFENPKINGSVVGSLDWFDWYMIVHNGMQSMPFNYDNAVGNSWATADIDNLEIGRDWTIKGVGILSLWFYGNAGNAAESMYVALDDSFVIYNDNPDAARAEEWTEWRIDLQLFAEQGVNLSNVNSITIGFGNKNNPQPGGSGKVFFDDIRLYRPAP